MNMFFRFVGVVYFLVALTAPVLRAQNFWIGGAGGSWTVGSNWSSGMSPLPGDNVSFMGAPTTISINSIPSLTVINSLTLPSGYTVTLSGGDIDVTANTDISGTLILGTDITSSGLLTIQNGGILQLHDGISGHSLTINGDVNCNSTGYLSSNSSFAGSLFINGSGAVTTGIRFAPAPNNNISTLVLNRSSSVIPLLSPLVVESGFPNPITLSDGILQTTPTNLLTLRTSFATGPTGPSYINGPFAITTTAPIGIGSIRLPISNSTVNTAGLLFFTGVMGIPSGTTITATPEAGPMTGDGTTIATTIPAPQNRWKLDISGGIPDINFLEITDLSVVFATTRLVGRSVNQTSGYGIPIGATPNMPVGSKISMNFAANSFGIATYYFAVGSQLVPAMYSWTGSANTDFQNPNNWSPTRTTPATNDQLTFSNTTTITNIPSQTIGQLNLVSPANVTFQTTGNPTLSVTSSVNIGVGATLNLGDPTTGANGRMTIAAVSGLMIVDGTVNVGDNAALRVGPGGATMIIGMGAEIGTSRADGIHGTSNLTGALQIANAGMISYGGNQNIRFYGSATQTANLDVVSSKPPLSNIATLTLQKNGGTSTAPQTVFLNSNTANFNINIGTTITFNGSGNELLNVGTNTTLYLNMTSSSSFGTGKKLRVQGVLTNNGTTTFNAGSELEINGAGSWDNSVGTNPPNYLAGSILRFTGAGSNATLGALPTSPTAMLGDLYVQKSSGYLQLSTNLLCGTGVRMFIASEFSQESDVTLTSSGSQIQSGGWWFSQNGRPINMDPGSTLEIMNGGRLTLYLGSVNHNGGIVTVRSGGIFERAMLSSGNTGSSPGMAYDAGGTLRLIDNGPSMPYTLVPGTLELPASMPGNIEILNAAATTITAPLTVNGYITIGTSNTTQLPSGFVGSGTLNLFGTAVLPSIGNATFNGALNLSGIFDVPNNSASSLSFAGTGAVTGSFKVLANTFNAGTLTLDRAGMILPLGSPVILGQNTTLNFQRGVLRSTATNMLVMTNINTSVPFSSSGENPASYIDGPMQRYLPANASSNQSWRFPIGKNGKYMPFSLYNIQTGGNQPFLQAEVFDTAPPNTMRDTSISALAASEYWRVDLLSGTFIKGQAVLERSLPILSNSVIAKAPSTGGVFSSIGKDNIFAPNSSIGLYNYAIGSATFSTFSLFNIATPTPPPPVVIPPALQAAITNFSPTIGTSGTTVIVTGANFNVVQGVSIGGVPVPFMVESPTRLVLGPIGFAQTGSILIQTSTSGTATTSSTFTFVGTPTITSSVPSAPIRSGIGQTIILNGTDFYGTPREGLPAIPPHVSIGNVAATSVVVIAPTQMQVSFPSVTSGILRLQAWGGVTTTSTVEILPPPVITAVGPTQLPAGFLVTVTGSNFSYATQVRVGGIPALSFTVNSPNRITVVVPPNAQGGVSVTTPGGTVTNATVITVVPPPTISGISPINTSVGQPITITGTNFVGISNVSIGGIRTTFTVSSSGTVITAIAPPNGATSASQATVSITAIGGTISAMQRITVSPATGPVLTGFSPNPATLGGTLLLTGVNLPGNVPPNPPQSTFSVNVNDILVPVLSVTGGVITVSLPANILPNSLNSTTAAITVTAQNGSTTASFLVPVIALNAPLLTSLSPTIGSSATTIAIAGQNLGIAPRGNVLGVSVAGVPVSSFMVISSTQIVAVLGNIAQSATLGSVTVTTPSGVLTLAQTFTFDPAYIPPVPVRSSDSLALVALYKAGGGAGWANRSNWLQDYVSTWYGVRVENGRVVELRLPNNGLSGEIGALPEFSALDALKVLDISGNRLAGVLPTSFASMRSLEVLNISDNIIVGEISQIVCGLQRIRDLNVANNRIQGELGAILCCLPRVERVNLRNNLIGGGITRCIRDLQNLAALDASNNRIADTLPHWLSDIPLLAELRLRGNLLRGKLPAEWGRTMLAKTNAQTQAFDGISVLDIGQNQLSGTIPTEWGALTTLRELALDNNTLTSGIPIEFQNLRNLRKLLIQANRFTSLPNLTDIRRLDTLAVENNALTFADLEANTPVRLFTYAPQSEVGSSSTTTATLDALFSQRFLTSGTANRYEWRKISTSGNVQTTFPATNDGIMRIAAFQIADTGFYRCAITNSIVPNLTLTSATVRVLSTNPTTAPSAVVLLSPERGETDIALRPVLAWIPAQGASHYDIEISTSSTFSPVNVRDRVQQSVEGLLTGRLERLTSLLQPETRYFWRVRAVNSVGTSAWSDVRDSRNFITVKADVAVSVESINFGNVPRLDTALATMRVTNVTNQPITLNQITLAPTHFLAENTPSTPIAPGQVLTLLVRFLPQNLGLLTSSVTIAYTLNGNRIERTFETRLRGVGTALKVVPPNFNDVIVGRPRISSGLIINRSPNQVAVVRKIEVVSAKAIYQYLPNTDSLVIGIGDTATATFLCRPRSAGVAEQTTVKYEANTDTAEAPLQATARFLRPGEFAARIAARAVPPSAPPGAQTMLELYLQDAPNEPVTATQRQALFQQLLPSAKLTLNFSKNVLTLVRDSTQIARSIRNTAPRNLTERVIVPLSAWDIRLNQNVMARIPVMAVAGEIDVTNLVVEDIDWSGVALESDTLAIPTFRAEACEAGGKRLVTTAKPTQLTALAPNPAKDVLNLAYNVREDSFVEIALVDMKGSVVIKALQKEHEAGEYLCSIPLGNIPQGAYFVRLTTPNTVLTRRVAIVR